MKLKPILMFFCLMLLFSSGFAQTDTTITLVALSQSAILDSQSPVLSIESPNGGEEYEQSETIDLTWSAVDDSFDEDAVTIYLSPDLGAYFATIAEGIENSGAYSVILPEVNSAFARWEVFAIDHFGNSNTDLSDGYFTIGDPSTGGETGGGEPEEVTLTLEGLSESSTLDSKKPVLEWVSPNNGDIYGSVETIEAQWSAVDDSFDEDAVSVYLSPVLGAYYGTVAQGIPNTGSVSMTLPEVNSAFARFKVFAMDYYGNRETDYGEGYFTIGEPYIDEGEYGYEDTSLALIDLSVSSVLDSKAPLLEWLYPNGGEDFDNNEEITVSWLAEDESFGDTPISIFLSAVLGGNYEPFAENIPNTQTLDVTLPSADQAFVRFKTTAVDTFGNFSEDYGDDYFILGDPFGDYNVNDYEDMVIVDWGWGDHELILMTSAALDFLDTGDEIHVLDENGIVVEGCDHESDAINGMVSVSQGTYEDNQHMPLYCYASVDYCDEGGDRFPGYIKLNPITYLFHDISVDEYFTMEAEYQSGHGYFGAPNGMIAGGNFLLVVYDQSADASYTYPQWFEGWYNNNGGDMDGYNDYQFIYDFNSESGETWPAFVFDDFNFVSTNRSGLIVGTITIDGSPASPGDWIAAFDEYGFCVGAKEVIMNEGISYTNISVYGDDGMGPVVSSFTPTESRDQDYDGNMVIRNRSFDTFNIYRDNVLVAENSNDYFYVDEELNEGEEYCYRIVLLDDEGNELITSIEQCATVGEGSVQQVDVDLSSGWNMVGLPVLVDNADYQALFPEAYTGALYSYNGSYQTETTLIPGTGYLLRLAAGGTTSFSGLLINELTLSLTEGWNLISGISTQVDVDVLYSSGIIATGGIYGYDGSYVSAETIDPGMGYWVRALNDGEITLSSITLATKTVEQVNHLEGSNTLEFSNGTHTATLYFGKDVPEGEELNHSLPPVFPQMAFDARFTDNMRYAKETGEIEVMNTYDNLTINYDVVLDVGEHMSWILTLERGEEYVLNGSGLVEISGPVDGLTLSRKPMIPITFALHQNYPNPFNPITSLRYDLPEQAQVTLTIYNLMGREIAQLINTTQDAGFKSVQWNATDTYGKPVSAGVYLYQIRAGEFVQTKKMILLK